MTLRTPMTPSSLSAFEPTVFKYNGGIVDFVKHLNASKEALFNKVGSYSQAEDDQGVEQDEPDCQPEQTGRDVGVDTSGLGKRSQCREQQHQDEAEDHSESRDQGCASRYR